MTVQTTTTYQSFAGGQGVLTFNFRTLVSNPNYINVQVTNLSNNTTFLLTYGTNYTVVVNTTGVGGTVTVNPSYGTGYDYTVYRDTGAMQNSSYTNFNQFPGPTLENGLDQLTMLIQEMQTTIGLTIQSPLGLNPTISTVLPSPQPNYSLAWNSSGTGLINTNLTGSTGPIGPQGPAGSISLVSSSTADITVVSTSTTPIITSVNAATAGSNTILRLDSSGNLPPLNAKNLTNTLTLVGTINPSNSTIASFGSLSSSIKYVLKFSLLQNTSAGYHTLYFNNDTSSVYGYGWGGVLIGVAYSGGGVSSGSSGLILEYTSNLVSQGSTAIGELFFTTVPGNGGNVVLNGSNTYYSAGNLYPTCGGGKYLGTGSTLSSLLISSSAGSFTGTIALYQLV